MQALCALSLFGNLKRDNLPQDGNDDMETAKDKN